MNELEVLRGARKSLAHNWWDGHNRKIGEGGCLLVQIDAAGGKDGRVTDSVASIVEAQVGCSVMAFNDSHTHAEVLALLDTVIAKLEEQTYGDPLPEMIVEMEQVV